MSAGDPTPGPSPQGGGERAVADGSGVELPEGVLAVRVGPGANCSSAGSAIDILFYGSVIVGAVAVALAAAFPPRPARGDGEDDGDAEGERQE